MTTTTAATTTGPTPAAHLNIMIDGLGRALHKTLRQSCGSQKAYLAWLLINLADEGVQSFWRALSTRLLRQESPYLPLELYRGVLADMRDPSHGATALKLVLTNLPDDDVEILIEALRFYRMVTR
jgi:hypothetical protein